MAGKKEVQKTVAFRLNLSRADERELYQAIMKHDVTWRMIFMEVPVLM